MVGPYILFLTTCSVSFASAATPGDILATIQLDPKFQIELVAMEPAIRDPVDIEFDEQGRLFAIEMAGYPFPETPGNLILLKDADGDGVYETRKVFATGFALADSILAWHGGLLVASPPNIEFLKDTDGDDIADVHEIVLEGFAVDNPQHNVAGLTYGLDNWIYASNGENSGNVYWPGDEAHKVPMRFDDVRFDPGLQLFQREGRSTGGYKLTFDDWGRMFGTHNLTHISQLVFPGRYIDGLPVRREGSLLSISDHDEGETARIFPIGVQDTRVNHPEQSGYVSGGCGITHYGGGAFGDANNGNVFVCDVVLNLVHRDVLSPNGAALKASRKDERIEFLASTDRAFRPVNMDAGPDGALYLVDMHRVVIEHPEWIPDEIEEHLDLNAGKDQGRIFRITPKGGLPRVTPKFDRGDLPSVAAQLASPNQWTRTTAQRILVEWQDPAAIPALENLLANKSPRARLHALWTLDGLHALKDGQVLTALGDTHPGVRENALKLAEPRMKSAAIRKRVESSLADSDARVRMFAALAFAPTDSISVPRASSRRPGLDPPVPELINLATRPDSDQWIRMACAAALKPRASEAAGLLLETKIAPKPGEGEFLELVATIAGQLGDAKQLGDVLEASSKAMTPNSVRLERFFAGLAAGLKNNEAAKSAQPVKRAAERVIEAALHRDAPGVTRETWRLGKTLDLSPTPRQRELLDEARRVVEDHAAPADGRAAQLAVFKFAPFEERVDVLFALLDKREPSEIQRVAIQQLREDGDTEVAKRIIANWRALGRDVLDQAGNLLLYQRGNHDLLMTALEKGDIAIGQLNLDLERRRTLLHSAPEIAKRAEALFTDAGVVTRKDAMERMRPSLSLKGDALKGHAIFTERCSKCHKLGEEGNDIAPNLTDIFRKSAETLLHDIVDPNAAVDTRYVSYAVETNEGEFISGIIAVETDQDVTLRQADGNDRTLRKSDMKSMYTDGLSLMPEELEVEMMPQSMADLLAFLQQPR